MCSLYCSAQPACIPRDSLLRPGSLHFLLRSFFDFREVDHEQSRTTHCGTGKGLAENPRWKGIKRGYSAADVVRLRGNLPIEHTLARHGAERLWQLVNREPYVNCLGALTGGQAMQQVKAGSRPSTSGRQVAADNNNYAAMYPDQSLYPVDSVPKVVERINNAFRCADEIQCAKGIGAGHPDFVDYYAPIVADAEAGFGGVLNAFELR